MALAGTLVGIEVRAAAADMLAAQLARIRASSSDTGIQDLRDLGPQIRRARGDTELDDRKNKDGVLIQGARLSDPVAAMLARGTIERSHAQAAEKLRQDVEVGAGSLASSSMDRLSFGSRGSARWPSDEVLDALARVRAVIRDLEPEHLEVCEHVVLRRRPIAEFALAMRRRRQSVSILVTDALAALALHYGLQGRDFKGGVHDD
jgi:hypothetical protein